MRPPRELTLAERAALGIKRLEGILEQAVKLDEVKIIRPSEDEVKAWLHQCGINVKAGPREVRTTQFYVCPHCSNSGLTIKMKPGRDKKPTAFSMPCDGCEYGTAAKLSWESWSSSVKDKALPPPNAPMGSTERPVYDPDGWLNGGEGSPEGEDSIPF